VVDRVATPRAEAIEQFAGVLRALRAAAGSPSFRTMSGRSHAISHTTLHEAAQGHRLPSWATTAEFVKACDADPAEFRERWEQANQIIRSAAMPSDTSEPRERPDEEGEMDDTPPSGPLHEPRRWLRHVVLVTALAGTLAAGLVVIGVMASRGDSPQNRQGFSPRSSAAARPLTAADCPVQQSNPPAASPPDPGDAVAFIADITLPDCTHVPSGSTSIKIWRFKNIGTVPWRGFALHRIELPQQRDQCQTITDVPIKDTEPGQMVDIKVTITAPDSPAFCFVRFKMEDASGRIAFPGDRPVNFQLVVD
jgi:Ig-like domain from next to BRCA1 gene/Helix-turn-helix domain